MAVSSVTVLGGFSGEGPREEGFRGLDGTKGRKGGRPCGERRTSKARDRERRRDRGKGRGIPGFKREKAGGMAEGKTTTGRECRSKRRRRRVPYLLF